MSLFLLELLLHVGVTARRSYHLLCQIPVVLPSAKISVVIDMYLAFGAFTLQGAARITEAENGGHYTRFIATEGD